MSHLRKSDNESIERKSFIHFFLDQEAWGDGGKSSKKARWRTASSSKGNRAWGSIGQRREEGVGGLLFWRKVSSESRNVSGSVWSDSSLEWNLRWWSQVCILTVFFHYWFAVMTYFTSNFNIKKYSLQKQLKFNNCIVIAFSEWNGKRQRPKIRRLQWTFSTTSSTGNKWTAAKKPMTRRTREWDYIQIFRLWYSFFIFGFICYDFDIMVFVSSDFLTFLSILTYYAYLNVTFNLWTFSPLDLPMITKLISTKRSRDRLSSRNPSDGNVTLGSTPGLNCWPRKKPSNNVAGDLERKGDSWKFG